MGWWSWIFFFFLVTSLGLWNLSSLIKDWTLALGSESVKSWPLDHQGIPAWVIWVDAMHSIPRVLGVKEENECVRVRLGDVRMEVQVGVMWWLTLKKKEGAMSQEVQAVPGSQGSRLSPGASKKYTAWFWPSETCFRLMTSRNCKRINLCFFFSSYYVCSNFFTAVIGSELGCASQIIFQEIKPFDEIIMKKILQSQIKKQLWLH